MREIEAVERDVSVGIGEAHGLETDLAERARQRVGAVENGVLGVEEHEDAVERGGALLDGGEVAPEAAGGAGDDAEAGQEAGEVGDGDRAGVDAHAHDEEEDGDGDADEDLHHRGDPRLPAVLPRAEAEEALEDAVGAFGERLLQAVGARHADAGKALGDLGGHRGDLGLGAGGEAPQPAADAVDRDERGGEDEADADGERPVDAQHEADGDDDGEDAGDAAEDGAHRRADQADVGGEPRGEAGGRLGLQAGEVGADEADEHRLAELGLHAVGDAVAGDLLEILTECVGAAEHDHPERSPPDHGLGLRLKRGHHHLDQLGVPARGERHDAGHQQRDGEELPLRPQPYAPEPPPGGWHAGGQRVRHGRAILGGAGSPGRWPD